MKLTKEQVEGIKRAAISIFNKERFASCAAVFDNTYAGDGQSCRDEYADFYGMESGFAKIFPNPDYFPSTVSEETTNQRVLMLLFFAEAHK